MKKTTIKYAAMLQDVQDACKKNERIVGKELGKKYKATNSFISGLLKLGWIERKSRCRYNWKAGDVSLKMAQEIADFLNEEVNGNRTQLKVDFKEPKVQQKPKLKKEVKPVKTETVSWFWGLYTKTVKG